MATDLKCYDNFLHSLMELDTFDHFVQEQQQKKWTANISHMPVVGSVIKRRLQRLRFNPLIDFEEQDFRKHYRFSKENMRRVIEMVRDDLETDRSPAEHYTNQVPLDLQVMAAIRYWGQCEHPEATANAHGVSTRTLAKITKRIAGALAANASRYLRMPVTLAEKEKVTNAFEALAGMPHVIGAITHFMIGLRRKANELGGRNDKDDGGEEHHHMHIQIVSDAYLKIRDLDYRLRPFVSERNFASDIFMQTRIKERFEQNEFRGRVLLGDGRLSCTPFLFTPVQCPNTPEEHAFNCSHASTFAPANKCLNLWMKRFGILNSEICSSFSTARQTIIALALLHNMAIEWSDESFDSDLNGFPGDVYNINISPLGPTLDNADANARSEFIKNNF